MISLIIISFDIVLLFIDTKIFTAYAGSCLLKYSGHNVYVVTSIWHIVQIIRPWPYNIGHVASLSLVKTEISED